MTSAFKNDFGVSGRQQIVRFALHEFRRRSVEAAKHLEVFGLRRHAGQRSHLVERRAAEHDRNGHVLAARLILEGVQPGAVARAGHVEILLIDRSEHRAIDAPIGHACVRVLSHDQVIVSVGVAVAIVMQEHRQDS